MLHEQPTIRHSSYLSEDTVLLNYGAQQWLDVTMSAGQCVG
jgi:hypothetical protein